MLHNFKINIRRFKHLSIVTALAVFVITTSGYPLATVPGNLYYIFLIFPIFVLLLVAKSKKTEIYFSSYNTYNIAYISFVVITLFSFIVNFNTSNLSTNIKFLFVITFAYLFTFNISFSYFIRYYLKSMRLIVIVSLIGHFLINIIKIPIYLPTFTNINDVEYYNGIIYFAIKSFGVYNNSGMNRNIGCFWEPGLFATFILIAIIFELVIKKNTSKTNLLIFFLGLLSTYSTFAYLMLVPITFIVLFSRMKGLKVFILFLLSLIFVAVAYINYDLITKTLYALRPDTFGKLIEESVSVTDRIESPLTNLKIFLDHPIFGAGIGNTENIFSILTYGAQTSTSTYFLAAFGIFGFLHLLFFSYGILKYSPLNLYTRTIILIVFLTQINKEPHIYFSLTFIIMFYFLKQASLTKKQQK